MNKGNYKTLKTGYMDFWKSPGSIWILENDSPYFLIFFWAKNFWKSLFSTRGKNQREIVAPFSCIVFLIRLWVHVFWCSWNRCATWVMGTNLRKCPLCRKWNFKCKSILSIHLKFMELIDNGIHNRWIVNKIFLSFGCITVLLLLNLF